MRPVDTPIRSAAQRGGLVGPSKDAIAEDFKAIDEGRAIRMGCLFRATYGSYPKRFRQQSMRLTQDGLLFRPSPLSILRRSFWVREGIQEARVRSYVFKTDWNVRAKGNYAEGRPLAHLGFDIISCRTELGLVEFAVRRPDVPLVLYFIKKMKEGRNS